MQTSGVNACEKYQAKEKIKAYFKELVLVDVEQPKLIFIPL